MNFRPTVLHFRYPPDAASHGDARTRRARLAGGRSAMSGLGGVSSELLALRQFAGAAQIQCYASGCHADDIHRFSLACSLGEEAGRVLRHQGLKPLETARGSNSTSGADCSRSLALQPGDIAEIA